VGESGGPEKGRGGGGLDYLPLPGLTGGLGAPASTPCISFILAITGLSAALPRRSPWVLPFFALGASEAVGATVLR
jgi:hypothetical protein